MLGGTICWAAALTGPSQASASIWPIGNNIQPTASYCANRPAAKTGAVMTKQTAGMRA